MIRSKRPSYYPPVPFHLVRTCSLISTVVTTTIMIYFICHLTQDDFKIPWAFLVLTAASVLTLLNLVVTYLVHFFFRLSPLVSLVNNSILLILWIVSLSLLSFSMKGTLYHSCTAENWGNDTGMMVCRIYKVLFTFTVTGFSFQVLSTGLDFFTRRAKNRRNAYNVMNGGGKDRDSIAESYTSGHSSNDPKVDALNAFGTSRPAPVQENPAVTHQENPSGTYRNPAATFDEIPTGTYQDNQPATYQETVSDGYYRTNAPYAWSSDAPAYEDPPVQEYSAYRPDRYQVPYSGAGYRR